MDPVYESTLLNAAAMSPVAVRAGTAVDAPREAFMAALIATPGVRGACLRSPAGWRVEAGAPSGADLTVPLPEGGALALTLDPGIALTPDAVALLEALAGGVCARVERELASRSRTARLEARLDEQQRRIARLEQRVDVLGEARDGLMSLVNHDLRSPLGVVLGNCQMLQEGLLAPAQQRKALDMIRRQTERVGQLVDEVQERFRRGSDAGGERADLELGGLVEKLVEVWAPPTGERGQRIRVEPGGPAPVVGDAVALREAIGMAIANALRVTPDGGTVTLRVWADDTFAIVEVDDEGREYSAAEFDPERAVRAPGLRVCRRIASAHGGDLLTGAGALGGGRVTLRLPRAIAHAATHDGEPPIMVFGERVREIADWLSPFWRTVTTEDPVGLLEAGRVIVLDGAAETAARPILATLSEAGRLVVYVGEIPEARALALGAFAAFRRPLRGAAVVDAVREALRVAAGGVSLDLSPFLNQRLAALVAESRAARRPMPVLVVTPVGLDALRRTHGWIAGDQLPRWVASELRDRCGAGDTLGRIGGDAFVVLLPGRDAAEADAIREELREYFSRARPRLGACRVPVKVNVSMVDAAEAADTTVEGLVTRDRDPEDPPHGTQ